MLEQGFQFAPIGVSFVTPDKKFIMASPFMTTLLGHSNEEFLDKYCFELTHEEDKEEFVDALDKILNGQIDYFQQKKRCIHKEGHDIWVDAFASGLKDKTGSVKQIMVLLVDIREMVKAQQEVEKKIQELEKLNQTMVSRELKMTELKQKLKSAGIES